MDFKLNSNIYVLLMSTLTTSSILNLWQNKCMNVHCRTSGLIVAVTRFKIIFISHHAMFAAKYAISGTKWEILFQDKKVNDSISIFHTPIYEIKY